MTKIKTLTCTVQITIGLFFTATTASAQAQPAVDSPFGIAIGVSACEQARSKIDAKSSDTLSNGDILLHASNPSSLFKGASDLLVRCSAGKVVALQLTASKGFANADANQAHRILQNKYKLVAGGAMPNVGDGYAKYQSASAIVELDSPHMAFDYVLTYYTKPFFEILSTSHSNHQKEEKNTKERSL